MKRCIIFIILLLPFSAFAQDTIGTKVFEAVRTAVRPDIDGKLDDAAWLSAVPASDFDMNQPIIYSKPTERTEVRIVYDDYAIYVGAMLYDSHPDSINHQLGFRDDDVNADLFRFVIDPYNTRQDAYDFGVYASGVQIDSKFSDYTYDAVWESAVKINEQGWCVEMRIPYSAIRFPKKDVQQWGLQLTRSITRKNEFDQWALTPPGVANSLLYWGTLKGIEKIDAPLRLSFTPYLSTYYEKVPVYKADGTSEYSNAFSYNAGADMKYGIDERFTVDITLLPDFGQVQSDNKVKNLGYREVTYDENREFFREGTELFNKGGLFYSRRIGKVPSGYYNVANLLGEGEEIKENPSQVKLLNAMKLSGRTNNGLGIGVFNAVTANTYAVISDSLGNERRELTEPLTNYNIFVFQQQMKNNSDVYFTNTNVVRDKEYDDANVSKSGITMFNKKQTYAFDIDAGVSQRYSLVDPVSNIFQTRIGYEYFIGARKTSGQFQFGGSRSVLNNSYDTRDLGFFRPNNFINHRGYVAYNIYKPNRFIRNSYNTFSMDHTVNYLTKKRTDLSMSLNLFATLLNWYGVFAGGSCSPVSSFDYYEPRTDGWYSATSEWYYFYAGLDSDPRKKLFVHFSANVANFFRANHNHMPDKPGVGAELTARYRVSDKLSFTYGANYSMDPWNPGFVDLLDTNIIYGARYLETYVNTLSGKYIFKNDMALTLSARHYWATGDYVQYYQLERDGDLIPVNNYLLNNDFSYNAFNIDLVYLWQFAPGSTLSVVYKNAIEKDEHSIIPVFMDNFRHTIGSPQVNSLSVKFLYYLDYHYLAKRMKRSQ